MILFIEKDTAPVNLTFKYDGVPVDVTGYGFTLKIGYPTPVALTATILNQTANKGQFEFEPTATSFRRGEWQAEILTTFPDNTEYTQKLGKITIAERIE